MKKIYFISVILMVFTHTGLFSQGWEKVYADIYSHDSRSSAGIQKTQITADGGNILIGYYANPTFINTSQSYLIKTNSTGDVIWSKTFSDNVTMIAESVIETSDGFLIGGTRYSNPTPSSFLIKVDLTGNTLWSKKYSGTNSIDMIQKSTTGFIILGGNGINGGNGIYCAKIDNNGIIIWTKILIQSELYPKGIAPAENDGFILIGSKPSHIYGRGDECYIMKFDSTATLLWTKTYSYTNSFWVNCIKLTNTGDYIIGGAVLMKIDKDGNLLWVKYWQKSIYDINQTADNGYIIAEGGYWNIDGFYLCKVSSEGIPEWRKTFGGKHDGISNVYVTGDHGFLVSGHHGYDGSNIGGLYLIKTDSSGNSGCNTNQVALSRYPPSSSLCIINNVSLSISGNPISENITPTSNSVSVNAINPCCFAKAEINFDDDINICNGDYIPYSGYGSSHLQWSTGDTTSRIVTMDTIVYLTATNTCGSFMDTLMVHPGRIPSFTYHLNKDTICRGDSVLLNITGNVSNYSCYGQNVKEINETNYALKPTATSNYTVSSQTAYHGYGCDSHQTFTVYVNPDKPIITKIADTLFSSFPINNQWFLNGNSLSGATSQSFIVNQSGTYSVQITGSGCSNESDNFSYAPDTTNIADTIVYARKAWQKMIKSDGNGAGTCIVQADDGGLIIGSNYSLGGNNDNAPNKEDITLIKNDRNGEVIWSRTYGGSGIDHINSLIKVNSGYVAVGSTTSFGNGNMDAYILSFDEQGQLLWSKAYGDWNDQEGRSIEQTSDGGFIVTGYSTNPYSYSVHNGWLVDKNDLYLFKTDGDGNLLWSKTFDASDNERGFEVHETTDGNFIVGGSTKQKIYVLKTDPNGNLLWSKLIANASYNSITSLKITTDENCLICTSAYPNTYLFKIDSNGNVLWSKIIHDLDFGWGNTLVNDGSAVFTGYNYNSGNALTKIDMNGDLIWSVNYNAYTRQGLSNILQLNDSSFIMTGGIDTSNSYRPGQINLINAGVDGQINCSQSFSPAFSDAPYSYYPDTTLVSSLGTEMNAPTNSYSGVFKSSTLCQSASFVAAPLASNQTICSGNTISLSAIGTGTLGWYSQAIAGNYLGGGANFITPALTSTTTYYVQDSSALGSSSRTAVLVTVIPSPPSSPSALSKIICSGNTASLSATGIGTLGWYSEAFGGNYLGGGTNFTTPNLTTTTTYYVQDSTCVTSTTREAVVVTVNPLPIVTATASTTTLCAGTQEILNGGGASSYSWSGGVTDGNSFIPSSTNTYNVTGTDANGCSDTSTITINVNPLPTITAFATATNVCAGETITLLATGANSYIWTGGINNGVAFTPSSTATYNVTGSDLNNCSNSAAITVNVSLLDVTTNFSEGTITANQNGATYQWLDCTNSNLPIAGETNQSYTPAINGEFAVIITKNGCVDTSDCVNVSTTGVAPLSFGEGQGVRFFPNPNNGSFTIQATTEGIYSITNELGQTIQQVQLNKINNYTMNIENLNNGIYFIVGFNENQIIKQKIVVSK